MFLASPSRFNFLDKFLLTIPLSEMTNGNVSIPGPSFRKLSFRHEFYLDYGTTCFSSSLHDPKWPQQTFPFQDIVVHL